MFIPHQLTRLWGLISLVHQTTNFPFSFVQEQNLLAWAIRAGFFPTLQKYPLKEDLKLKVNVSNYMYNDFMTFKRQASEMYLVFPGRANLVIWKHSDYHSS